MNKAANTRRELAKGQRAKALRRKRHAGPARDPIDTAFYGPGELWHDAQQQWRDGNKQLCLATLQEMQRCVNNMVANVHDSISNLE